MGSEILIISIKDIPSPKGIITFIAKLVIKTFISKIASDTNKTYSYLKLIVSLKAMYIS